MQQRRTKGGGFYDMIIFERFCNKYAPLLYNKKYMF